MAYSPVPVHYAEQTHFISKSEVNIDLREGDTKGGP